MRSDKEPHPWYLHQRQVFLLHLSPRSLEEGSESHHLGSVSSVQEATDAMATYSVYSTGQLHRREQEHQSLFHLCTSGALADLRNGMSECN